MSKDLECEMHVLGNVLTVKEREQREKIKKR